MKGLGLRLIYINTKWCKGPEYDWSSIIWGKV